jgi:2-polyprenyl-3-methyl-5-hydroxy-6-metoxy-1,4-benzoquinol methylase
MTVDVARLHELEVTRGERFEFGENWLRFAATVSEERIVGAERSLTEMLELDSLAGLSVLDIGCGSGLFSLAAVRLGAGRVHSFDFDPTSARCTAGLKQGYAPGARWTIETGNVLDRKYVRSLGEFDLVYAWGVLHHTGDMWTALDIAGDAVAPEGRLFLAIYNDQGRRSRRWRQIKRTYNALPARLQVPFALVVMAPGQARSGLGAVSRRLAGPRGGHRARRGRGMSRWHDLLDWCGGYPFEVARPEQIFDFYRARGFRLRRLATARGGPGCNQFVFVRSEDR